MGVSRSARGIGCILIVVGVSASAVLAQTLEDVLKRGAKREELGSGISEVGYPGLKVREEEAAIPYVVPKPREEAEVGLDKKIDPEEYIVGPRDKLTVYVWGQLEQPFVLDVTPEGTVFFPTVGVLDVAEKSLAEVKSQLTQKARAFYEEEDITVALTVLRSFRVFVTGQVENPGTYKASAVDRVSDLIEYAGGFASEEYTTTPGEAGYRGGPVGGEYSMRNITVRHRDGRTHLADLQWFFRTGSAEYNSYVKMGDVIHVPPKQSVVDILGAVHAPGSYEFREGDTIETLLALAGGLRDNAFLSKVEVARFVAEGQSVERITVNLEEHGGQSGGMHFALQRDDRIFVRSLTEWHVKRQVTVIGEAKYPGTYLIERGKSRLLDIVEQAGGLTDEASLGEAQVIRGRAYREPDPELERLRVMSAADMSREEYEYFKVQSRLQKGILAVDFVELFERDNEAHNILLRDGDVIYVPRKRETVNLTGQVNLPGLTTHVPNQKAEHYIKRSGGYSWNADKGGTRVIKGTSGLWLRRDKAGPLEAGDSVFIPEKASRDWWGLFKDATAVFGQVATVIIVTRNIAGY